MCLTGSILTTPSHAQDMSWVRPSHGIEVMPGKGVKCWVATQDPYLPLAKHASPTSDADADGVVADIWKPAGGASADIRVLVGNRQLLGDEGVRMTR